MNKRIDGMKNFSEFLKVLMQYNSNASGKLTQVTFIRSGGWESGWGIRLGCTTFFFEKIKRYVYDEEKIIKEYLAQRYQMVSGSLALLHLCLH